MQVLNLASVQFGNMNGARFIQFNSRNPRKGDQEVFNFIISEPQLMIYLIAECP